MVFEQTRIQQDTKAFRDEVAGWAEGKIRKEADKRGIPGAETVDLTTLREAIVEDERDALRADVHGKPYFPPG